MKAVKHKAAALGVTIGIVTLGVAGFAMARSLIAGPTGANGRISGCYSSTGALRVLLPGSTCGTETHIGWVGHLQQVTVSGSGTWGNSYGVRKVTHTAGSGIYDVYFKGAPVNGCVQVASLAFSPGDVSVEGFPGTTKVQVQTYNANGASADQTFQLLQSC